MMVNFYKKKISSKKVVHIFWYCCSFVILALACVFLLIIDFDETYIAVVGVTGGLLFFVYAYIHCVITHRILDYNFIFTALLFLFCFGQFFLYGLGVEYDYFFQVDYYRSFFGYDDFYILYGEVISVLALGMFQLSMLVLAKPQNVAFKPKKKIVEDKSFELTAKILFIISFPIMIVYKIYCLSYALLNGYANVGNLEQPFLVRFVGVFFIPATIMLLVTLYPHAKKFLMLCMLLMIYSVIGLVTGGRTEPLVLLVSILALILRDIKIRARGVVLLLVIGYLAITLLVSVAEIRVSDDINFSSSFSVFIKNLFTFRSITSLIGEMGFSGSSTLWTIYLIKTGQQEFYFGVTYLGAVANILPSSLDVLGVLGGLEKYCYLEDWLTGLFNVEFGVGFNLIAEAYLNFGVLSFVFMFFYARVLNHLFNCTCEEKMWKTYRSLVMFAVLMTLPRRATLYLADQWALCVLAIWLLYRFVGLVFIDKKVTLNGKVKN